MKQLKTLVDDVMFSTTKILNRSWVCLVSINTLALQINVQGVELCPLNPFKVSYSIHQHFIFFMTYK